MYDPETEQFSGIDTCFSSDHNQLGHDDVFYYGFREGVGWVDTKIWDETGDAEAAQGWCPTVIDTNGDGVISPGWTEPDEPVDPARDHRVAFGCYSPAVNDVDGSIWCSDNGPTDNTLVRLDLGDNPPLSCISEVYTPPPTITDPPPYGSGGLHLTRDGVVWQDWRGSGHFASFDRSKCDGQERSDGQTARAVPKGWTFNRMYKPTFENAEMPINADESYLTQIDHHDVLGFGPETPVYGDVNTDSLQVFIPATGEFVTMCVPYPMGFFSRSSVGRIDDPTTLGGRARGSGRATRTTPRGTWKAARAHCRRRSSSRSARTPLRNSTTCCRINIYKSALGCRCSFRMQFRRVCQSTPPPGADPYRAVRRVPRPSLRQQTVTSRRASIVRSRRIGPSSQW